MMTREPVTCVTCELHAEAVFRVDGMDCNEEVVILERRLKPLAGMEAVSADVIRQRLHVKYDAAKLTTSAMVDAVGQTGMRMWLEHEEPRASGPDVQWRMRLMAISGIGLAGGAALSLYGGGPAAVGLLVGSAATGAIYPIRRAVTALRSSTVDINVLMVIAVVGAMVLRDWVEAASVVFLFSVAQWLEVRTLERARQAISSLLDLSPRQALVVRRGVEAMVAVEEIGAGEHVIVRPGEKVAVDGEIIGGSSDVNEAPITGESLPITKNIGAEVFAGSINGRGALELRVTRVGRDTRLAHVIHLVEQAQARRAPVQFFVDRFARIYTPAVIAVAAMIALVPPLVYGGDPASWVYRALVLLVIACPCALVISTPVSIVAALSAAARHGVLVKGGIYLERLAAARIIAFDKTGTLTSGSLSVAMVIPAGVASQTEVIRLAASVESRSEHSIARAVTRRATDLGIEVSPVTAFTALPGRGAEAYVGGRVITVGNRALFEDRGIELPPGFDEQVELLTGGSTVVFVAADRLVLGAIAVADSLRPSAREAVDLLRSHGIKRVVMLTGDQPAVARQVAASVGIDEVLAGLLPSEKYEAIRGLHASGPVVMVGDGINDGPALAAADVGIAMGAAASDVALETADVALLSAELLKLPYAIRLARATLRNVKTNVAISLVLKAAFLILAIAGNATLWMAVLADTGATVIVVANALRLLRSR
jgi:Zn2+/Cd2+-exporting ATPase